MSFTITVPPSVWYDALDPLASGMQAELELPEPVHKRSVIYENVSRDVALELADYLMSRGALLLDNSDPAYEKTERDLYRRMIKSGERIRALVS